jgi:hypothetical protein
LIIVASGYFDIDLIIAKKTKRTDAEIQASSLLPGVRFLAGAVHKRRISLETDRPRQCQRAN